MSSYKKIFDKYKIKEVLVVTSKESLSSLKIGEKDEVFS
jgi:hypothetical protein